MKIHEVIEMINRELAYIDEMWQKLREDKLPRNIENITYITLSAQGAILYDLKIKIMEQELKNGNSRS